jgi:hypothetical protein
MSCLDPRNGSREDNDPRESEQVWEGGTVESPLSSARVSGDVEFLPRIEMDCQEEIPTPPPDSPSRANDRIGQVSMSYLALPFGSLCHRLAFHRI